MSKILTAKQKGINRHWKNFLDKDYLGSHNLEEGEELLVTIARFEGEEEVQSADGKKSPKTVLYFKEKVPTAVPTTIRTTGGRWDTGLWDVAVWSEAVQTRDSWTSVTGIGYCGAVRMRVAPNATLYIDLGVDDDTSLAYEADGIIAMQSARNTNAPCEIIAFNLKYENQTGGQL